MISHDICIDSVSNSYQEGLKQSKVLQEKRLEEENTAEKLLELKNKDEESGKKINKSRSTQLHFSLSSQ